MPVTIEDVKYTTDYKGIVYEATVGERTRKCMVRVADLDLPRGKDSLHEFMRRINEVKAATETVIEGAAAASFGPGSSVLVVRLAQPGK
jgi:hypothetical protein